MEEGDGPVIMVLMWQDPTASHKKKKKQIILKKSGVQGEAHVYEIAHVG